MTTDAPPSYQAAISGIDAKLAGVDHNDVQKVHDILASFPADQKQVLAANTNTSNVNLTDSQKATMGASMIDSAHSAFALEAMKASATNATNAINAIELMFANLLKELSAIDSKYPEAKPAEGEFAPRLQTIINAFRTTVATSRDLAVDIAVYGERFDEVIMPVVLSTDFTNAEKSAKVKRFIEKTEEYKSKSGQINADYQQMYSNMVAFTGKFSSWATAKESQIDTDLDRLRKELGALVNEIKDKRIAMITLGAISAASLPITGVIAACTGPAAPAIIVIGLITAGVTAITAVALAFVISNLEDRKKAKENEIKSLEDQKADLKTTRAKLEMLGKTDLAIFKSNIDVLAAFWLSAVTDAKKILVWLDSLEDDFQGSKPMKPEILKKSADPAVTIYKQLSEYLTAYAKGVSDSNLPKN